MARFSARPVRGGCDVGLVGAAIATLDLCDESADERKGAGDGDSAAPGELPAAP